MELNEPKSEIGCEAECSDELKACKPSGEDKTICFDNLRKCLTECESIGQAERK